MGQQTTDRQAVMVQSGLKIMKRLSVVGRNFGTLRASPPQDSFRERDRDREREKKNNFQGWKLTIYPLQFKYKDWMDKATPPPPPPSIRSLNPETQ